MRDNQDFERLRDACDIMAKLRCRLLSPLQTQTSKMSNLLSPELSFLFGPRKQGSGAHINLASLEGGFGESAKLLACETLQKTTLEGHLKVAQVIMHMGATHV